MIIDIDLVQHLEHTIWTFELEHDLSAFSIAAYLNWFDFIFEADSGGSGVDPYTNFPDRFLHYLEQKVSNPCSQLSNQVSVPVSHFIRENLTFITTICCVT